MNYEDFCKLERVGSRAISAARAFATGEDEQVLKQMSTVLAELRHAADFLCDPFLTVDDKRHASHRLLQLFTGNPK